MNESLFLLPNRRVLRLSGADTISFLQGLITANARHITPGTARYGAMLTAQGKMLADFFLYADGADVLLETDADRMDALLGRLKIYKLRSQVTLTDVSDQWHVVGSLDTAAAWPDGSIAGTDSRHETLGTRALVPASASLPQNTAAWEAYETLRLRLGVPNGSADYTPERSLPLELGLDHWGAIDHAKGCYVGQEVTTRSKHRLVLRKALCVVQSTVPLPAIGTPITTAEGAEAGELHSSLGNVGIAMLRLEYATQPLLANSIPLSATVPEWVPVESK